MPPVCGERRIRAVVLGSGGREGNIRGKMRRSGIGTRKALRGEADVPRDANGADNEAKRAFGKPAPFWRGQRTAFAYGQRTAGSKISEAGGEKVMPEPEEAGVSEAGRGSAGQ